MKKISYWIWLAVLAACLLPAARVSAGAGVEVGGIHILNTDVAGKPLPGAVFQLVKPLEAGEQTQERQEKKLVNIGGENTLVAVMPFWDSREMTGSRSLTVTTDAGGKAAMYGLSYGTYYLIEEQAPAGYNRIQTPIRVSIHRYSHLTAQDQVLDDDGNTMDNTLHILNVRCGLPDRKKVGLILAAAGLVGIVFSALALWLRRTWVRQ